MKERQNKSKDKTEIQLKVRFFGSRVALWAKQLLLSLEDPVLNLSGVSLVWSFYTRLLRSLVSQTL